MLEGVFEVIMFPIWRKPAPLDGRPLLFVDEVPPNDRFEVFKALFPAGGKTEGIFRLGCYEYFLVISGMFSVNSLSKEDISILV
jgi:hypothetical protein